MSENENNTNPQKDFAELVIAANFDDLAMQKLLHTLNTNYDRYLQSGQDVKPMGLAQFFNIELDKAKDIPMVLRMKANENNQLIPQLNAESDILFRDKIIKDAMLQQINTKKTGADIDLINVATVLVKTHYKPEKWATTEEERIAANKKKNNDQWDIARNGQQLTDNRAFFNTLIEGTMEAVKHSVKGIQKVGEYASKGTLLALSAIPATAPFARAASVGINALDKIKDVKEAISQLNGNVIQKGITKKARVIGRYVPKEENENSIMFKKIISKLPTDGQQEFIGKLAYSANDIIWGLAPLWKASDVQEIPRLLDSLPRAFESHKGIGGLTSKLDIATTVVQEITKEEPQRNRFFMSTLADDFTKITFERLREISENIVAKEYGTLGKAGLEIGKNITNISIDSKLAEIQQYAGSDKLTSIYYDYRNPEMAAKATETLTRLDNTVKDLSATLTKLNQFVDVKELLSKGISPDNVEKSVNAIFNEASVLQDKLKKSPLTLPSASNEATSSLQEFLSIDLNTTKISMMNAIVGKMLEMANNMSIRNNNAPTFRPA